MKLHCYKKWWKERSSMTFWWILNCDKTLDRSLLMIIRAFIQCSITADFCCFGLSTGGWITSWSPRDSRRTCVTALSNRRSWAATTVQSCYWWRGSSEGHQEGKLSHIRRIKNTWSGFLDGNIASVLQSVTLCNVMLF